MHPHDALTDHLQVHDQLQAISAVLAWDQQTYLPAASGAARGEQLSLLAGKAHAMLVDDRVAAWLEELEADTDLGPTQRASVRNIGRSVRRARALPSEIVQRMARLSSDGFAAWMAAREANDFSRFAPLLARIVETKLEQATLIDPDRRPYDVLLEPYDPGTTTDTLAPLFARLAAGLQGLLDAITARPALPALQASVPADVQLAWHRDLVATLGYDFDAGRMDLAEHPFTIRMGPHDVRITTRVVEDDLLSGLGGSVHEAGHAMYEQGLPELPGTMVGTAASMGLHESQSRFWENIIGRSLPFFRFATQRLVAVGGPALDPEAMYRGANRVEPGLVRVEADEVTYNLHVIVRFELERALFAGELAVDDLEEAWNTRYAELLGVTPPDARRGVLQDVHWSSGAFGYFPSYTLGNLYAASLGHAVETALPSLWDDVARGEFAGVLAWLRDNVHRHGHHLDAPDLMREVVGERDHVADLLDYLWARHGALAGAER